MARSTDALQRALNAWGVYTHTYERFALLNESLADSNPEVLTHFHGSLERYIQQERMYLLEKHWGGLENGTPAQAEEVNVPADIMVRVNGIVGHYGIPRVFLFLYVHAYLWSKVMKTGPLEVLNDLLDELDPR